VAALRRILKTLTWGAAGLLVTAFLFGYAAPYLPPPRFWWANLLAIFVPPLGGAVGVLALGLIGHGMYQRRWGRVVVAGGLLLLLALRFGPRIAAWSRVSPSVGDLQVMTLNVPPTFGADSPGSLAALVGTKEPNLLAFQESRFWTGDPASSLSLTRVSLSLRPLLSDSVGYAPPRQLPANTEIQQPVLGRPVPESLSVHPLPPRGKTDARSRYTRTQLTWRGRPAALYNVHLHTVGAARPREVTRGQVFSLSRWRTFFQTYREGALRRAQQARLIRRAIEREDRPVIVVGDFNSTPHQWAYRHIARGLQSAAGRRIQGWAATFPAGRPLVHIDHVLASPDWRIVAAEIPGPKDGRAISDHRPVFARLRWKTDSLQ